MCRKFQFSNRLPNRYFPENYRWVPLLLKNKLVFAQVNVRSDVSICFVLQMKTCCYLCKTREKYLVLSKFQLFRRCILIFVLVIVILQFLLEYNYWCYVSFFLFVSSVYYFMLCFILFKLNLTIQTFVKVNPVQGEFKNNLRFRVGSRDRFYSWNGSIF